MSSIVSLFRCRLDSDSKLPPGTSIFFSKCLTIEGFISIPSGMCQKLGEPCGNQAWKHDNDARDKMNKNRKGDDIDATSTHGSSTATKRHALHRSEPVTQLLKQIQQVKAQHY